MKNSVAFSVPSRVLSAVAYFLALAPMLCGASACSGRTGPGLEVVDRVDIERYMGKWYSIASIPQVFTKPCAGGTTAFYTLLDNGLVKVENACYKSDGSVSGVEGRAWVVDKETNARLKVSFIPFIRIDFLAGDYWIIDLGPDYEYAVVGHPERKYGWILSRTKELPQEVLDGIVERLEDQGYDFSDFKMVDQESY